MIVGGGLFTLLIVGALIGWPLYRRQQRLQNPQRVFLAGLVVILTLILVWQGLMFQAGWQRYQASQTSEASQLSMVSALAERLQNSPDNHRAWLLLARSYVQLGQWPAALNAWKTLYQQDQASPEVLLGLAEARYRQEGRLSERTQALLAELPPSAHQRTEAIWLRGVFAYQSGQSSQAKKIFLQLQSRLPAKHRLQETIRNHLKSM
jgi:cytochrome c-type biogenesis protein CcmH/NrfG